VKFSIKKLFNFCLDLLFPIECLECGKEGNWLCENCFRKLDLAHPQYCLHCKTENQFGEFCTSCKHQYALDGVFIAGNYQGIIQKLIKNFKYRFNYNLGQSLGKFLNLFLLNLLKKSQLQNIPIEIPFLNSKKETLLVPVPLHKRRHRWRGFNQAAILADSLSAQFQIKINHQLVRTRYQKAQAKLNRKTRLANLHNAFAWVTLTSPRYPQFCEAKIKKNLKLKNNLKNYNILLVDDVVTSGATLNECARILKDAGAHKVWGVVLANG